MDDTEMGDCDKAIYSFIQNLFCQSKKDMDEALAEFELEKSEALSKHDLKEKAEKEKAEKIEKAKAEKIEKEKKEKENTGIISAE